MARRRCSRTYSTAPFQLHRPPVPCVWAYVKIACLRSFLPLRTPPLPRIAARPWARCRARCRRRRGPRRPRRRPERGALWRAHAACAMHAHAPDHLLTLTIMTVTGHTLHQPRSLTSPDSGLACFERAKNFGAAARRFEYSFLE